MGTHTFFEKNEETTVDELYCKCDCYYQLHAKTNKVLKMSRVLLKDNSSDSADMQEKDIAGSNAQLMVRRTFQEALNLFLAPGKEPPRTIPEDQNCSHLVSSVSNQQAVEHKENKLNEEAT